MPLDREWFAFDDPLVVTAARTAHSKKRLNHSFRIASKVLFAIAFASLSLATLDPSLATRLQGLLSYHSGSRLYVASSAGARNQERLVCHVP